MVWILGELHHYRASLKITFIRTHKHHQKLWGDISLLELEQFWWKLRILYRFLWIGCELVHSVLVLIVALWYWNILTVFFQSSCRTLIIPKIDAKFLAQTTFFKISKHWRSLIRTIHRDSLKFKNSPIISLNNLPFLSICKILLQIMGILTLVLNLKYAHFIFFGCFEDDLISD